MRYSCYFAPYKLFCCSFHFQIEHKEPFQNKCESHEIEAKLRFQTDYNINEKHFCFLSPRKIFFKIVIRSHLSAAYFNIGLKNESNDNSFRNHLPFRHKGRRNHRHVHERKIDFLVRVNILAPDDKKLAILICQDFLVRSNDCVDQC